MRNFPFHFLAALVATASASPVPAIEWVTVTAYTTILLSDAQETRGAEIAGDTSTIQSADVFETTATSTFASNGVIESLVTTSSAFDNGETTAFSETVTGSTDDIISETASTAETTVSTSAASGSFSGEGTFYDTGLGSCGITSTDTDYIVAISHELYDKYTPNGNPNHNTLCGKKINVTYEGNTVEVTVVDRCEGCAYYDLDLSPSAFSDISDQSLGRIDITWEWA